MYDIIEIRLKSLSILQRTAVLFSSGFAKPPSMSALFYSYPFGIFFSRNLMYFDLAQKMKQTCDLYTVGGIAHICFKQWF